MMLLVHVLVSAVSSVECSRCGASYLCGHRPALLTLLTASESCAGLGISYRVSRQAAEPHGMLQSHTPC
jgi:hypothetical protein